MKELTRDEFNYLASKNNWEVFSEREVYQFSQSILKSIDPIEKEHGAIDFVSLMRQEVRNNDLSKSVVYWRESQVEWEKASNGELMKARSGVYKDTPVNRKKGLVGQKYGTEKKVPEKKEMNQGGQSNESSKMKSKVERYYNNELSMWRGEGRFEKDSGALDRMEAAENFIKETGSKADVSDVAKMFGRLRKLENAAYNSSEKGDREITRISFDGPVYEKREGTRNEISDAKRKTPKEKYED